VRGAALRFDGGGCARRVALADRDRPDAIVVAAMNPEEFVGDDNFASNVVAMK